MEGLGSTFITGYRGRRQRQILYGPIKLEELQVAQSSTYCATRLTTDASHRLVL